MKDIELILNKYLHEFPKEKERQLKLIQFLNTGYNITDWNNFNGHIVASGFIYSKVNNKFLVLYHKDLKNYMYPGGHINPDDKNPLETAKREVKEETGLSNLKQIKICNDELIPIDIDTHIIEYNERLNLPKHYHFDFRYLFIVDEINQINIDTEELENYKWIDINELSNDFDYGIIVSKLEEYLKRYL